MIIEVKNLRKTYQTFKRSSGFWNVVKSLVVRSYTEKVAVHDISFSIKQGEFVGFLGPNGAGKTTTLKMLSGILYPTSGVVNVLGFVPWHREAAYQKQMSIVMGQKSQLWFDLPAQDSFDLLADIYDLNITEAQKTVKELSVMLDVTDLLTTQVRRLSLGERMKMELIAALVHKPKVLFLDEPTIGLDVVSQKNIREFLRKINQQDKVTILLTSHYMEDIAELCERVIIINEGKVIFDDALATLLRQYETDRTVQLTFEKEVSKNELQKYGEVRDYKGNQATLLVHKNNALQMVRKMLDVLPVIDFSFQSVEADEVIRKVFTEGLQGEKK